MYDQYSSLYLNVVSHIADETLDPEQLESIYLLSILN
jgi:hypothetical protein